MGPTDPGSPGGPGDPVAVRGREERQQHDASTGCQGLPPMECTELGELRRLVSVPMAAAHIDADADPPFTGQLDGVYTDLA